MSRVSRRVTGVALGNYKDTGPKPERREARYSSGVECCPIPMGVLVPDVPTGITPDQHPKTPHLAPLFFQALGNVS